MDRDRLKPHYRFTVAYPGRFSFVSLYLRRNTIPDKRAERALEGGVFRRRGQAVVKRVAQGLPREAGAASECRTLQTPSGSKIYALTG